MLGVSPEFAGFDSTRSWFFAGKPLNRSRCARQNANTGAGIGRKSTTGPEPHKPVHFTGMPQGFPRELGITFRPDT